jgi:uncharacterized protein YbjT (DUF2867 family)
MAGVTAKTTQKLVTVFGGSGFLGRHVVRALAKRGYRVRVAVRRPDLAGHLQPMGIVGQVQAIQANLRYLDSVARAVQGADAVVNLVGILSPSGNQSFEAVQAAGAGAIATACRNAGITNLVHVSAIGADIHSDSAYARSKAEGEASVLAAVPDGIILRPSIVFGPEDRFFNRFASLARFLPALPLIGGGQTKFQPVFVGDVAEAVVRGVDGTLKPGAVYELGGPEVVTFEQILRYILTTIRRKRLLIPMPWPVARLQAGVLELLPKPLLTRDQVTLLERDNVVSPEAIKDERTLDGMGIAPASIAAVVPAYLWRFRRTGQFEPSKIG